MTCLTCQHGHLRDQKDQKRDRALRDMARNGFINCNLSPYRATFHPLEHVCERFSQADDEVVKARMEWRTRA